MRFSSYGRANSVHERQSSGLDRDGQLQHSDAQPFQRRRMDAFTLSSSAQVTGFTYNSNFATPNDATGGYFSPADYVSTNWWI